MTSNASYVVTPLEQLLGVATMRRQVSIGLPGPAVRGDRRFPLTPEAVSMLSERGFKVKIETGAASAIHYDDIRYAQHGADIVPRQETLRCDIVVSLSPISVIDARQLRRGALFLTMYCTVATDADIVRMLLRQHVITIALDKIEDENKHKPFADILAEISGRASISVASSLLANPEFGKGILLGGIAGIVPCEVTIIGSGIDACAAARSAVGLGAFVRMFDNDVYRLRNALRELGPGVMGSAMHPRVLMHALQAADVVVATSISPHYVIGTEMVQEMKAGVITFDLSRQPQPMFPSLMRVDLASASASDNDMSGHQVCYVNPCSAVPRTTSMALSNTFLTLMSEIFTCDGLNSALMLNPGLQSAALTFLGKPVETVVARTAGLRPVDIKLILQFS